MIWRALVITGAGDRVFSAGADLTELPAGPDDPLYDAWRELAETMAALPVLTVAMINGACIGGGMTLALGCDIRVCVSESSFAYPVLKNGILLGRTRRKSPARTDRARSHGYPDIGWQPD